jgi:hypothetical protein
MASQASTSARLEYRPLLNELRLFGIRLLLTWGGESARGGGGAGGRTRAREGATCQARGAVAAGETPGYPPPPNAATTDNRA